jgi:SAM-dependent methyltransferase
MFTKSATFYDRIYAQKDYKAEVETLIPTIRENLESGGDRLLDAACGTGHHLHYLKQHFSVEGLDINPQLLEYARQRNPNVPFHQGDIMDFDLDHRFDIITCLFSSIGYVKTLDNLSKSLQCMSHHLVPGGLLIVEPWFTPDQWMPRTTHALFIDEPELKIARINTSFVKGTLSYFDLHYLIGTPQGTEHFVERHELGLFEIEETLDAFAKAAFEVQYDDEGLTGRGLYLAKRPL